ncbi:hypothetical protein ACOMHN_028325 [Nucella lapillus]
MSLVLKQLISLTLQYTDRHWSSAVGGSLNSFCAYIPVPQLLFSLAQSSHLANTSRPQTFTGGSLVLGVIEPSPPWLISQKGQTYTDLTGPRGNQQELFYICMSHVSWHVHPQTLS